MSLVTGAPLGTITAGEDIYIEGAPYMYFQEIGSLGAGIDGAGFYWGLSGTAAEPVYRLACYEDMQLSSDITVNNIRCDNVGDKDVIQKLNHLELTLSLSSLFPLSILSPIMRAGPVTTVAGATEKMGIGTINNNKYYRIYLPKVYDDDTGDWVSFTIHRAKFVDAWTIAMPSGDKWMLTGLTVWGLADDAKPAAQQFATVLRADPSAL